MQETIVELYDIADKIDVTKLRDCVLKNKIVLVKQLLDTFCAESVRHMCDKPKVDKEKVREYCARWREKNKDKHREYVRNWMRKKRAEAKKMEEETTKN